METEQTKAGDAALDYVEDDYVIKALINLKKGQVVANRGEDKRCFLNAHIFIPDAFLCSERIVFPHIFPEHSKLLSELSELRDIIHVPKKPLFDMKKCDALESFLTTIYESDPRNVLSAYLPEFDIDGDRLKKLSLSDEKITFDYHQLDETKKIMEWIKNIEIDKLYESAKSKNLREDIAFQSISQSLTSKIPVIDGGYSTPNNFLQIQFVKKVAHKKMEKIETLGTQGYPLIKEYLDDARKKIYGSSKALSKTTSFCVPYGLAVILQDIKDGKGPDEFFDAMIEKREEFTKLRGWITDYDEALKRGNHKKIIKYEHEVNSAAKELVKDYGIKYEDEGVTHHMVAWANVVKILLEPSSFTAEKLVEYLGPGLKFANRFMHPHKIYIKELGKASITDIKKELIRCFPKQGVRFADTLYYYSVLTEKRKQIAEFSP